MCFELCPSLPLSRTSPHLLPSVHQVLSAPLPNGSRSPPLVPSARLPHSFRFFLVPWTVLRTPFLASSSLDEPLSNQPDSLMKYKVGHIAALLETLPCLCHLWNKVLLHLLPSLVGAPGTTALPSIAFPPPLRLLTPEPLRLSAAPCPRSSSAWGRIGSSASLLS